MKDIQAIFFDFDGVILESVDVKGWAFGRLFEHYPEYVDQIVAFHYANGGMSRFDKFRYIYTNFLRKPLGDKEFEGLCEYFSSLVYDRVLACAFVPGALEFLKNYYTRIPLFVISGTPHQEIIRIVAGRRLKKYFKGVFGSPTPKGIWANKLIKEYRFAPATVVFVGDALSDYHAAKENGLSFVARVSNLQNNVFRGKEVEYAIQDLSELPSLVS